LKRYVVTSLEGFVQQVATCLLRHGYWFYVMGYVPSGKDPERVYEKLEERYGLDVSKWARARRKRAGFASVQYLRYERTFVLFATKGKHEFFAKESEAEK